MKTRKERIQYLVGKAQRGAISSAERTELATLVGRNPRESDTEEGLKVIIGIALFAIVLDLISGFITGKK
jgi:hypothetical protein